MSDQTTAEWGERRRRREEERLRALAAQQASGQQGEPGGTPAAPAAPSRPAAPTERPLSRRELRERAEAAAAAPASGAAPVARPAASPAVQAPTPPVVRVPAPAPAPAAPSAPAAPAPAPSAASRPLSRRELRAAATGEAVPARPAPEVQPPALTGGIRRVSASGGLTDVEPTADDATDRRPGRGAAAPRQPAPTGSALTPQARAAAVRAQAARAQAEREEAARRSAERAQAQRRVEQERTAQERAARARAAEEARDPAGTTLREPAAGVEVPVAPGDGTAEGRRRLRGSDATPAGGATPDRTTAPGSRPATPRERAAQEAALRAAAGGRAGAPAAGARPGGPAPVSAPVAPAPGRAPGGPDAREQQPAGPQQGAAPQRGADSQGAGPQGLVPHRPVQQDTGRQAPGPHAPAQAGPAPQTAVPPSGAGTPWPTPAAGSGPRGVASGHLTGVPGPRQAPPRRSEPDDEPEAPLARPWTTGASRAPAAGTPLTPGTAAGAAARPGAPSPGGPSAAAAGWTPSAAPARGPGSAPAAAAPAARTAGTFGPGAVADHPTVQLPAARDGDATPGGATGRPEQRAASAAAVLPGAIALVPAGRPLRAGDTFGSMTLPKPADAPAARPGGERPADAGPRWSSVAPSATAWTPTPEAAPTASDDEAEEPTREAAEAEPVRAHPYTWLHMIVLVVVAFVLGMLIFMVVMRDSPPVDGSTGQAPTTSSSATTSTATSDPAADVAAGPDDPTGDL